MSAPFSFPDDLAAAECCGLGTVGAHAIADELLLVNAQLADLAFEIGSDPAALRRHMRSLQAIDLITQIQLALADILRSTAPLSERIDAVTVEALLARLRARVQPPCREAEPEARAANG